MNSCLAIGDLGVLHPDEMMDIKEHGYHNRGTSWEEAGEVNLSLTESLKPLWYA